MLYVEKQISCMAEKGTEAQQKAGGFQIFISSPNSHKTFLITPLLYSTYYSIVGTICIATKACFVFESDLSFKQIHNTVITYI